MKKFLLAGVFMTGAVVLRIGNAAEYLDQSMKTWKSWKENE